MTHNLLSCVIYVLSVNRCYKYIYNENRRCLTFNFKLLEVTVLHESTFIFSRASCYS